MNTVTVSLPKGGVGKSTVSINLADRFADRGYDVLLVDLDPQGGATEGLAHGGGHPGDTRLSDVVSERAGPHDAILTRNEEIPFDLLPSTRELGSAVGNWDDGATTIERTVLDPIADESDWVVFDGPSTIGPLATASIRAGKLIVAPILMSEPSPRALTQLVTEQLLSLDAEADVELVAIVPNRLRGDNEEKRILRTIEDSEYGRALPPFAGTAKIYDEESVGPGIRERIAIRRAAREGVPLATYDPDSDMLARFDELASIVDRRGSEPVGSNAES